jgi:adenosylhomocysteine nucleosidase
MNDLILFALRDEAPGLFENYKNVFEISVGKVNAAIGTARLISYYNPRRVINLGTAGGIRVTAGIHRINKIVQHDVNLMAMGLAPGQHLKDSLSTITFAGEGKTCASGDLFVTEPGKLRVNCDIVEMEAYSVAKACKILNVECEVWKYISDAADKDAPDHWQRSVAAGEQLYRKVLAELNVELIEK